MMPRVLRAGGCIVATVAATTVAAQAPPVVGVGTSADVHIGQGFLMTHGDQCLAITAAHVVEGRSRVVLTIGGAVREIHQGEVIARDPDPNRDVAIIRVVEKRPASCGRDFMLPATLAGRARAGVWRVDTGGAQMPRDVMLADVDPASDFVLLHGRISKGDSGALVEIDGRPTGMMLNVVEGQSLSRALRFDRLTVRVRAMLEQRPAAAAAAPPTRGAGNINRASHASGARVVDQTGALLVDADSGAFRLLEDGSDGYWLVKLAPGAKADVDIRLSGAEPPVITEVRLQRGGVRAADLARDVAVFTSGEGLDGLVHRVTITLAPDQPYAAIPIAPRPVRYLRLRMLSRDDTNAVHGFARVEVR